GMIYALDETPLNRIARGGGNDRNCCGCVLSSPRHLLTAGRYNDRDSATDEIVGEHRKLVIISTRPAEFQCDLLIVDKSHVGKSSLHGCDSRCKALGRTVCKKPDYWHCPLLSQCPVCPSGNGCSANKR